MNKFLLVPLSLASDEQSMLNKATEIAQSQGYNILLLHVIDLHQVEIAMEGADLKVNDLDAYRDSLIDQQRRDARARLQEIAEKLQAQGLAVSTEIEIGLPKQVIPRMVRRNDDLAHVVIGSRHALKLERMFRHNIAAKVQRKALCPVTVVELPARAGKQSLSDQNIKKF